MSETTKTTVDRKATDRFMERVRKELSLCGRPNNSHIDNWHQEVAVYQTLIDYGYKFPPEEIEVTVRLTVEEIHKRVDDGDWPDSERSPFANGLTKFNAACRAKLAESSR